MPHKRVAISQNFISLFVFISNIYSNIVFANIVADVILSLTPSVPSFMKKDGVYICSGIIEGRQQEVQAVLERSGFTVEAHFSEEDWHCFAARLSSVS